MERVARMYTGWSINQAYSIWIIWNLFSVYPKDISNKFDWQQMEIRLTRSNKKTLKGSFQKPANNLKPFTEKLFESHTMQYLSLSLKITLTCTFTAQREQRCSIQSANDTFTRASSRWKALIDRGIRLLTLAASNRLFVARTTHTHAYTRV